MVSIAIQENSLTDIINAGLTVRHYHKQDKDTNIHLIKEKKSDYFWLNLNRFADKNDNMLLIINIPVSNHEILEKIDMEPYEKSIIYLPSKNLSIDRESKKILLEKGIVTMPQRNTEKCFSGNYKGKIENRWMNICNLISFENKIYRIYNKTKKIIDGFITQSIKNPYKVIDFISNNDINFFENEGEIILDKIKPRSCLKSTFKILYSDYSGIDLFRAAIQLYLFIKNVPISIKGKEETLLLTNTPTLTKIIMKKCKINPKENIKLGKGLAMFLKEKEDINIGILMGKITPTKLIIQFNPPQSAHMKTLRRRLIGGPGPEGRLYRGLIEKYPEIEIKAPYIETPRDALENVIDVLVETGAEYDIII